MPIAFDFVTAKLRVRMGSHDLRRDVQSALDEAAYAVDGTGDSLLDRTDLQHLVACLRRALRRLERAYAELESENHQLTSRATTANGALTDVPRQYPA